VLPVVDQNGNPGSKTVGDGLDWLDGSELTIDALTLGGSARQSLLIDGPATGDIMSLTLEAGEKPGLQQSWMTGDAQPTLGSGVNLTSDSNHTFDTPQLLIVPASL
jgi:hypothetical protein